MRQHTAAYGSIRRIPHPAEGLQHVRLRQPPAPLRAQQRTRDEQREAHLRISHTSRAYQSRCAEPLRSAPDMRYWTGAGATGDAKLCRALELRFGLGLNDCGTGPLNRVHSAARDTASHCWRDRLGGPVPHAPCRRPCRHTPRRASAARTM